MSKNLKITLAIVGFSTLAISTSTNSFAANSGQTKLFGVYDALALHTDVINTKSYEQIAASTWNGYDKGTKTKAKKNNRT